jgi:DNA polymerase III subunit gamma/tau
MSHEKRMLSLSFRPRTFDDMVGQEDLLKKVAKNAASKHPPSVWLFVGESGSGKTSLARILATSYQCKHKKFGHPCRHCYKHRSQFNIVEVNASDMSIEDLRKVVDSSEYVPNAGSKFRVFIFDELHQASKAAQNLLLKYLEDCPATTIFIICTTEPQRLIGTLRRRCVSFKLRGLDETGVRELCSRTLKKLGKDKELRSVPLAEALVDQNVTSPGFVMMALQKYVNGASEEEAAKVTQVSDINVRAITKALTTGDWFSAKEELRKASSEDARSVRAAVASYLKTILLDSDEIDDRTKSVAAAIKQLVFTAEDSVILAAVASACHDLCRVFRKYQRG